MNAQQQQQHTYLGGDKSTDVRRYTRFVKHVSGPVYTSKKSLLLQYNFRND